MRKSLFSIATACALVVAGATLAPATAAPAPAPVVQVVPEDEPPMDTPNAAYRLQVEECRYKPTVTGTTYTMYTYLYFTISNGYETLYRTKISTNYAYGSYADITFAGEVVRISTAGAAQTATNNWIGWGSSDARYTSKMRFSNPGIDQGCTVSGVA